MHYDPTLQMRQLSEKFPNQLFYLFIALYHPQNNMDLMGEVTNQG